MLKDPITHISPVLYGAPCNALALTEFREPCPDQLHDQLQWPQSPYILRRFMERRSDRSASVFG